MNTDIETAFNSLMNNWDKLPRGKKSQFRQQYYNYTHKVGTIGMSKKIEILKTFGFSVIVQSNDYIYDLITEEDVLRYIFNDWESYPAHFKAEDKPYKALFLNPDTKTRVSTHRKRLIIKRAKFHQIYTKLR